MSITEIEMPNRFRVETGTGLVFEGTMVHSEIRADPILGGHSAEMSMNVDTILLQVDVLPEGSDIGGFIRAMKDLHPGVRLAVE